jgi:nicotinamide riboside transporter PnuC
MGILEAIILQWQSTHYVQLFAMFCTLGFAWFAGSESKLAWLFGMCNFGISGSVALVNGDYVRGGFFALFFVISVWGVYHWFNNKLYIGRLQRSEHFFMFALTLATVVLICSVLHLTGRPPQIMNVTFYGFGILAIYMTLNKALETWFYWAIINVASAYLSLQYERYLGLALILLYIPLTVRGLYIWTNRYYAQLGQRAEQEESNLALKSIIKR